MKKILNTGNLFIGLLLFSVILISTVSCKKFVEIEPPRTDLIRTTVFESDNTAEAAVLDIYRSMASLQGFASGSNNSVSFLSALSADEAINKLTFLQSIQNFYTNALVPSNSLINSFWSDLYNTVYKANAIIEGVESSPTISPAYRNQLTGEAFFIRGFCHFYLQNLFGDCPLVLSTDYKQNQVIGRTTSVEVYKQIKADLLKARDRLADDYSFSNSEKTRLSKMAATAFLARVCLYMEEWEQASSYATEIINSGKFSLIDPATVFLKNSDEAIWQLYPPFGNTYDIQAANSYSRLQPVLLAAFEPGDVRYTKWTNSVSATKYRSNNSSFSEYSVVLRLAEQYLIRAEAKTQLNLISAAKQDIDIIRSRASLGGTTANDKASLLTAIEKERRVELFMEWGHRWLDVKRWNKATAILAPLKAAWQPTDVLYPIPESQILNDPAIKQNPGY